jgi:hypothetical protein
MFAFFPVRRVMCRLADLHCCDRKERNGITFRTAGCQVVHPAADPGGPVALRSLLLRVLANNLVGQRPGFRQKVIELGIVKPNLGIPVTLLTAVYVDHAPSSRCPLLIWAYPGKLGVSVFAGAGQESSQPAVVQLLIEDDLH